MAAATLSSLSRLRRRTPWVPRPAERMVFGVDVVAATWPPDYPGRFAAFWISAMMSSLLRLSCHCWRSAV